MDKALLSCVIKRNKDDTYTFIGSDETLDRDGEVIKVDGWQLANYKKNPVVLWGHRHDIPAIGKAERVYKDDGKLKFKIRFAQEGTHELADTVKALIDDDILKSVSVGYIPLKREYPSDDEKAKQPQVITMKAELYELSVVNVPANQNALISSMKEKGYEQKTIDLVLQDSEFDEFEVDEKPYKNEHSCRLKPPNYDKYARKNCEQKHDGKCIDVIYGIKGDKSEIQALRYKTDKWTESAAKSHCKSREGTFEPAKKKIDDSEEPTLDDVVNVLAVICDQLDNLETKFPEFLELWVEEFEKLVQENSKDKSIYTGLFVRGDKAEKPTEKKQNPFHPEKKGNQIFRG